jgi:hypothetical protein
MRHEQHLSDEELVRAADGERGRRTNKARVHLAGCAECRARATRLEATIAELTRAQRNNLDSELPSIMGPRALLRTRLAEVCARESDFTSHLRLATRFLAGAMGVAALVAVVGVACDLALRHSGPISEATPQLSSDQGVLPNRDFTPGVARPVSLHEICALAHEEVVREVSPSQRQKVFEEYGIPSAQSGEYEVDFLITPGLGGDDDIRNLWPEPYYSATWNARLKDALEERLHEMVCSGQLDLSVAQQAIATNWISAYQKYVAAAAPKVDGVKEL